MLSNGDQALLRAFENDPKQSGLISTNPIAAAMDGLLVSVASGSGRVVLSFCPGSACANPRGAVTGVAVATMLDLAMTLAGLAVIEDGQSVATNSISVSYLEEVALGKVLVTATVERKGKAMIFAKAELATEEGEVKVVAISSLSIWS